MLKIRKKERKKKKEIIIIIIIIIIINRINIIYSLRVFHSRLCFH